MKTFLSHSSRQKLLARELVRRLPKAFNIWLDEKDISVGENIQNSIDDAFTTDLVSFILLIEQNSVRSDWVKREISNCLALEKAFDHSILIPVVVEKNALDNIQYPEIRDRNYITCHDFSDETLDAVTQQITTAIIAAGSKRIAYYNNQAASSNSDDPDAKLSAAVRSVTFSHREDNPLLVDDLAAKLASQSIVFPSTEEMMQSIYRLQRLGMLNGIFADEDEIFLSLENVRDKMKLNLSEKKAIGKQSAKEIQRNSSIVIDTGSTAFAFCEQLSKRIKVGSLRNLDIYTTSIPAANLLIDTLNDLNLQDDTQVCRITVIGGPCRPRSQGTVPDGERLDRYLPESIDVAIIGANGIVNGAGIGMATERMIEFKREAAKRAKRPIFLMEHQKFNLKQTVTISSFDEGIEIVTGRPSDTERQIIKGIISQGAKVHEC